MKLLVEPIYGWGWTDLNGQSIEVPRSFELEVSSVSDGAALRVCVGRLDNKHVDNRDEYRHPDVPPDMRAAYREAFRHGYDVGMSHLTGAPDWRMRAPERPWDSAPNEFDAVRRQGYQDGIEGARKDFDNHRRPDVNNRDEYRHPHVPGDEQDAYRDGFRRGYQSAWDHMGMSHY